MKRRLKDFTVKLFSLILAITMCIPTNVYALADDSEEEMPTIMRLDEDSESGQTEETSDSEDIPTISEEDRNNYDISYDAKLSDSFDSIIYTIKVSKKEESIHDPEKTMTLALATNKNQSLTDLHIDEVRDLEEGEVDIKKKRDLHTCAITTPTAKKGVEYTIKAPIAKDAIDTEKLYSLDMSVDIGDVNIDLKRISYKFMEEASEDNPEEVRLVLTNIKEVDDAFQKIAYNKSDEEDKADTLVYTDYLISKDKQDEASISERKNEVSYKLILDENQDQATGKIALDYFKANDKGFVLQKEFSTEIAYQEDLTLDVPAGYLLKLTYTNQVDKTKTKVENYSVNNRAVKNPRFVKEEEKAKDDDEDPAPAEKEEQPVEKDSDKQTKENESKDTNTDKKEEKKEEPSKKEEKAKEPTNLEKADAELKKALADPKNTITEIQALLDTFEKKYNLSQEDQEKLMTDNDAAIKALVEKDRNENTRLNNLRQEPARAPSNDFSNKLFHLNLDMNVKASPANPIPAGWYFDVQLGSYLKEDIGQQLKDLTDETGRFVAYATYNKESHTIRYKFIRDITKDTTLTVNQYLAFDTTKIGDKESIDIDIKVAPKNNPVQSMKTITVKKDAPSPVESNYIIEEQGPTTEITYPYQLSYETKPSLVKDSKGNEINNGADLSGAYVEWNIEVDTSTINKSDLEYNKLNLTVFGSNKQGLKNFKFKTSKNKDDLDEDGGYRSSASTKELLFQNSLIDKKDIGDKLYIRVKGYIDPNHPHPEYSIGFRINPDNNYVTNLLKDIQDKFNSLPTPLKWLEGVEDAKRFGDIPFNLVETMIPARVNLRDNFTNEGFYYDHSRTVVATRESNTRVDWHALDLLRIDETEDPALSNPEFLLNGSNEKNPEKINKVYYVPLQTGSYRRTTNINDVLTDEDKFYPGTIVAYEYVNQEGNADDVYNLIANIKEKKVDNLDPSYNAATEGGLLNLFIERVSNSSLKDNYVSYIEHPYSIMRINKNFDMVQCFNSGIQDPTYKGSKGIFLDIHEDVSGDYLISRLNESIGKATNEHRLVDILKGEKTYDGVNFNPDGKPQGEAMEDLMKRVYFYGEEVKKQYADNDYGENIENEEMHRMIETSMYQRVVHHLTDGKSLGEDYFKAPSDYNVKEWKVPYTLTGRRETYPKQGYEGQYTGNGTQEDRYLTNPDKLRKLKENEKQIADWPSVQGTEYRMAEKLWEKVKESYGENSNWTKAKADSVQLVFYSHTESTKYQELITGRVTEPIQIDKYDESGNKKLENAEFSFYNIYTGEEVKWTSSKDDKEHKLYLKPGTYRVRETKAPTGYQKLKDFTIEVSREEVNGDKGPYNFVGLPEIHVNDGYRTKISLDDVPVSATGKEMVEIDENNNIKVKVINIQDNLGKIRFTKKNKYTKLNGAEFTLRRIKADTLEAARAQVDKPTYDEEAYKQVSTGSYGIFQFDQIPTGFYVLEETKTPAGYKKADNKLIVATPGTDAQGKSTIDVKFDDEKVYQNDEAVIVNEPKDTEIKFRKIREEYRKDKDTEHLGLANAKFRLESIWTIDGSTYSKEVFSNQPEKSEDGKKVDDENLVGGGYFSFKNIPIGEYKLIELQSPSGYQKTDLAYWKLVVKENKEEGHAGEVIYELYEVPKNTDPNSPNLTKVDLDQVLYNGDRIPAFQIGNEPRKKDTEFIKKLGVIKKNEDGSIVKGEDGKPVIDKTVYDKTKLKGKDNKPVSFNLYKADYYGAILKDKDGNPILAQENITQQADGKFHLKGLEFGGYYVLREMNPPDGYTNANDILLKVEAEAIANEGEMRITVRDPNTNTEFGDHAVFEGVVDFKEGEQLGEFSIKKTGRAIDYYDKDGNKVKVDENNPIDVGLRRAYFRLYTTDSNFEIIKEGNFAKEYIQKVTPGEPIIRYEKNPDGSFKLDENGNKIRIGVDPSSLPKNQGIVTFDNLTPGYYLLEEYRGPAGYEKTTEKWYVRVLDNGRVIRSSDKNDPAFTDTSFRSRRLAEVNNLNIGDVSAESLRNNILKSPKPVPTDSRLDQQSYTIPSEDATITVNAGKVDTSTGSRDINISIKPTGPVSTLQGEKIHAVFMVDRLKDQSGGNLDKNINYYITQLVDRAKANGSQIDLTIMQFDNGQNNNRLSDIVIKDSDTISATTKKFTQVKLDGTEGSEVSYRDYLEAGKVDPRKTNNLTDPSASLKDKFNNNKFKKDFLTKDGYDNKYLFVINTHRTPTKSSAINYKNVIDQFKNNGFNIKFTHIVGASDLVGSTKTYVELMQEAYGNDFEYYLGGKQLGNTGNSILGKGIFQPLADYKSPIKDATINLNLANSIIPSGNMIETIDGNESSVSLDNRSYTKTFSLPKADSEYKLSYKIYVDENAKDSHDQIHNINDLINFKANTTAAETSLDPDNKLVTYRQKEEDTPQPPDPEQPSGDVGLNVKFVYSNSKDGQIDNTIPTTPANPGRISLQVEENGAYRTIKEVDALYAGNLDLDKIDSSKNYRLVYKRDSKKAIAWSLPETSIYNINSKNIDKDTKTINLTIQNGNTMEIFNIDETGFRIPLRVTKVNENKGLLTGSRFRARKLVNGDSNPIYEDGKPTGESEYPKYHDEEFDATSEATGLPGDNYFRELTPGIYELWEVQPPNGSFRLPTDENGNPVKWYFKVKVNEGKKPSDDDYMDIEFDFEYTFKGKNDSSWNDKVPESDREKLAHKTIHGLERTVDGKKVFDPYTEVVPDDHRSDPARPDAPYKGINDVWVTNYMTTTDLKFMKKDDKTQKNLENAVFSLKKALVDKDGNVEFDTNGKAKVDPQTGIDEAKKVKPEPYNEEKGYAEATASKVSGVQFTNIQAGTYILEETKPADGYKLNDDSFITIKFTPGEDGSWTQEVKGYRKENGRYQEIPNADTSLFIKSEKGDLESVENTQLDIDLNFTKMDASTNTKLNGTGFRLVEVDKNGNEIPNGYDREIAGFGSASYNFRDLTVGRYRLEETTTIEGFAKPEPWYFNVVQDPDSLKLKIEFENKDNSIEYTTDTQGNLQDVQVNNYSKIPLTFKKVTGEDKPLKDAYFVLKKVRESMDESSMSFDYYANGSLKTLVKNDKTYSYLENGELDNIDGEKVTGEARYDSVSGATKKYYKSNVRSQENGAVNFRDLDEGIYELIETDIPDGYEDATQQVRWIVEIKKGENGLEVIYNKETEDTYYKTYDTEYYKTYTANNFKNINNFEKLDGDSNFDYKLTNKKNTIDLRWKKYSGKDTTNLIKKYTRFDLIKVIPDPDDPKADPMDENIATSGVSYGGTRNIAASTNGIFEVKDLSKGIYVLYETQAPEGYELMDRQIVIKVYEDEKDNYTLKKKFFEMKKDENGNNTLVEVDNFEYIFTQTNPTTRQDEPFIQDGYFFVNNREKTSFILSKGFMTKVDGKSTFNHIDKGELQLSLYKDPTDNKNTDTNIYSHTINLGKDQYYKFPLGNIQYNVRYLLEETKAPAGYAKSKNKYKIEFRKVGTTVAPYLVGIVKPDGTDLKDKDGNLITDTGLKIPTGGLKIELTGTLANPSSSFKIVNNKTEVEFTKVGKDTVKEGDKLVDKEIKLEKVKFYLEKQDQDRNYYPVTSNLEFIKKDDKGYYIEKADGKKDYGNVLNPVSIDNAYTLTSDANGKFKIENLNDGFYQLIEPNAPKDENGEEYMKVQGAVKKFRILEGEVYIEDDKSEKKLNNATDVEKEKLTKITNVKPGKGEFELNKTDEDGESLDGVTFELYDSEGKVIRTETTKDGGKINFTGLPFGSYWIKETKTKDGYVVDRKIRRVLLGKDWNVPEHPINLKDVTKDILFENNQPELKSIGGEYSSRQTVYPNQQEAMLAYFKFNLREGVEVKPGDTFTLDFSDNVDLYGIFVDNNGGGKVEDDNYFNIISDAGLVAKAHVNDNKHSITYTFTEYIDNYKLGTMKLSAQLYVNRYKVPNSQEITVTAKAGNTYSDKIKVDYRGNTPGQSHEGYQDPRVDVSSYMLRLNPETNTFTTIVYVNQWNKATFNKYLTFNTDKDVEITSMKKYIKLGYGSHADKYQKGDLPDSYGVDLSDTSKYKYDGDTFEQLSNRQYRMFIGAKNPNTEYLANAYVVEIKGRITDKDAKSLRTNSYLYANKIGNNWWASYDNPFREYDNTYTYGYWTNKYWEIGNFETWSQFYKPEASSEGSLLYNFINYKNRIEYTKINSGIRGEAVDKKEEAQNAEGNQASGKPVGSSNGIGSPLEGATFELRKKSTIGAATKVEGSERTSDKNGKFFWEKLAPGKYEVWETKAPEGFKTPDKAVSEFEVDKNGNIINIKDGKLTIENFKNASIKIRKTDEKGSSLKGAGFELKQTSGSIDYQPNFGKPQEDGSLLFDDLPVGTYELVEKQAPTGYKKSDQTWQIEVTKDGEVKWLNSFDDTNDQMKATQNLTHLGNNTTHLDIKVIGIDKVNKTKRSIITVKAKPSELKNKRILVENGSAISQLNTKVRLVVSDDGTNISNPDATSYKLERTSDFSMALTINPQLGSDAGTNAEKDRYYKFIVDLPYSQKTEAMPKVKYQALNENGEFTDVETIRKTLTAISDDNITANKVPMPDAGKYLARDINLLTTEIGNKKLVNLYYRKVDYADKTKGLEGAVFELQNKDGTSLDPKRTATSDKDGYFEFKDIPDGEYKITEIKAPDGYALTKRTIEQAFIVENGKVRRNKVTFTNTSKDKSKLVTNQKALYPQTGGPGTWQGFTIIGAILMSLAAIYLALKKKQQLNQANPTT